MGLAKTGRAAAIRAFLREHPNSSAEQVAAGTGLPWSDVSRELSRMVHNGNVIAEKKNQRLCNLVVAREPWDAARKPRKPPKPTAAFKMLGMAPARASQHSTATQAPRPAQPCQTVEEFLQRGGKVEVLPVHWDDYARYPRVMGRTG